MVTAAQFIFSEIAMARLESTSWCSQPVGMKINGTLNIPEAALAAEPPSIAIASPVEFRTTSQTFSPTDSVDSAFVSRPTSSVSTATPNGHQLFQDRLEYCTWSSRKHLLYGAPGFSVAVLDSVTGSIDHLPVPMVENAEDTNFSQSEVLCMSIVGESQVWAGTDSGSLHIFDLMPDLRFSKHSYTSLTDPVLCIASRQQISERTALDAKTDVLLGSPYGNLTILSGELDERGGLKNALKCPRKMLQLGSHVEEGCSVSINCITPVRCNGEDTYWCGCGVDIVVLRRSDWKELARIDGKCTSQPLVGHPMHTVQLLSSEYGVWSCLSHSSTITLWDTKDYTTKLHITCCDYCTTDGWVDDFVQISALTFSFPLLFVGTNGGHLLVFKILEELSPSRQRNSIPLQSTSLPPSNAGIGKRLNYKLLGATHCGPNPIISIHTTSLRGGSPYGSPIGTSFAITQVLVTCSSITARDNDQEMPSTSQIQIYELVSSPRHSPLSSPGSSLYLLRERDRSLSISSSSSASTRRTSLSRSPLPKLTLYSVSPRPLTLLPLKDSC